MGGEVRKFDKAHAGGGAVSPRFVPPPAVSARVAFVLGGWHGHAATRTRGRFFSAIGRGANRR